MIINNIRKFRESKKLTQEQVAEAVKVSRQTINAMEKGNYEPSLGLAFKLAKFFQTSIEDLFVIK